jgi:hypothetical protein
MLWQWPANPCKVASGPRNRCSSTGSRICICVNALLHRITCQTHLPQLLDTHQARHNWDIRNFEDQTILHNNLNQIS